MILLADENIDQSIVTRLRLDGHEVLAVAELEPSLSDDRVLTLSGDRQRLLLTADKDFGDLVFRQQLVSAGVILIRLEGFSTHAKAAIVSAALREHETRLMNAFTVISPGMVRIRARL